MIKEALQYLANLSVKSQSYTSIDDIEGGLIRHFDAQGEEIAAFQSPRRSRKHTVSTVDDFVDAMSAYGSEGSSVWVSHESVFGVVDDDHSKGSSVFARDLIILPLAAASGFIELTSKLGKSMDHDAFRAVLKSFQRSCGMDRSIEIAYESVRWVDQSLKSDFDDSLGMSVRSQMAAATPESNLPVEISLSFPFFVNPGADFNCPPIKIYVDVNKKDRKFVLSDPNNSLNTAQYFVLHEITEKISESVLTEKVFMGKFSREE